jgi:hypothetical protein
MNAEVTFMVCKHSAYQQAAYWQETLIGIGLSMLDTALHRSIDYCCQLVKHKATWRKRQNLQVLPWAGLHA